MELSKQQIEAGIKAVMINERQEIIKKLESKIPNERKISLFGDYEAVTYEDKKFAEAIIKECIKIIREN